MNLPPPPILYAPQPLYPMDREGIERGAQGGMVQGIPVSYYGPAPLPGHGVGSGMHGVQGYPPPGPPPAGYSAGPAYPIPAAGPSGSTGSTPQKG